MGGNGPIGMEADKARDRARIKKATRGKFIPGQYVKAISADGKSWKDGKIEAFFYDNIPDQVYAVIKGKGFRESKTVDPEYRVHDYPHDTIVKMKPKNIRLLTPAETAFKQQELILADTTIAPDEKRALLRRLRHPVQNTYPAQHASQQPQYLGQQHASQQPQYLGQRQMTQSIYRNPAGEGQPVYNDMYMRRRIADVSSAAAPEGISSCAVLLLIVGLLFLLYTFFVKLPKGFHSRTRNQRTESSVVNKKAPVFLK